MIYYPKLGLQSNQVVNRVGKNWLYDLYPLRFFPFIRTGRELGPNSRPYILKELFSNPSFSFLLCLVLFFVPAAGFDPKWYSFFFHILSFNVSVIINMVAFLIICVAFTQDVRD